MVDDLTCPHDLLRRARYALLALVLVGLAAPAQKPAQAQTRAQAQAQNSSSAAQAATNPVRVADLLELPIVDQDKWTMGRVRAVVRTGDGKIQLLLPIGGLFRFGERLVPIPIERVALTGPQVMVVDMPPDRFQQAATWYGSDSEPLAATETISISRR